MVRRMKRTPFTSSVAARLVAFAVALAALFASAAVAGGQIDVNRGKDTSGGMRHMTTTDDVRGLAVAQDGRRLELLTTTAKPGRPFTLRLRIEDTDGTVTRDFDVKHTKRLHLIVVRRDLSGF